MGYLNKAFNTSSWFLYMCQTQLVYDQEIEVAFHSLRSSYMLVRGAVSITIDRSEEKEQVPIVREGLKKKKKGKEGGLW